MDEGQAPSLMIIITMTLEHIHSFQEGSPLQHFNFVPLFFFLKIVVCISVFLFASRHSLS